LFPFFFLARACVSIKNSYKINFFGEVSRLTKLDRERGEKTEIFAWPKNWKFLFLSGFFAKRAGKII